jgi:hypothetical protein
MSATEKWQDISAHYGADLFLKTRHLRLRKFNYDKKDAEVSLDYCAQTIIKIEETLERLNKPLSEE